MRLLNIRTLEFAEFFDDRIPPYAILSHRWVDGSEMTFKEFRKSQNHTSSGYLKIRSLCNFMQIRNDGNAFASKGSPRDELESPPKSSIDWVWIDTICIDKRSSAELTEAINSMFRWYQDSAECVAYLADVRYSPDSGSSEDELQEILRPSSWFTRGWTLQELLAPETVVFCNAEWQVLGHKCSSLAEKEPCKVGRKHALYGPCLLHVLSEVTGIPREYLLGGLHHKLFEASIAMRMSWASSRISTRREDESYCLLGLFNVNMPLIYGEGHRAFLRLQEEILKRSTDQSVFAWYRQGQGVGLHRMLAASPRDFHNSGDIHAIQADFRPKRIRLTNEGVEMEAFLSVSMPSDIEQGKSPVLRDFIRDRPLLRDEPLFFLRLACHRLRGPRRVVEGDLEIVLTRDLASNDQFMRWWELGLGEHTRDVPRQQLNVQTITISR